MFAADFEHGETVVIGKIVQHWEFATLSTCMSYPPRLEYRGALNVSYRDWNTLTFRIKAWDTDN